MGVTGIGRTLDRAAGPLRSRGVLLPPCETACSPDERSDIRDGARAARMSRSLSSGAHSRDPLAHPGYGPITTRMASPHPTLSSPAQAGNGGGGRVDQLRSAETVLSRFAKRDRSGSAGRVN